MIRVLIAEDELPLLRGIKNMIEKIDPEFQVMKCASNGRDAIDFLMNNPVDVLFTDINMPLADGIELLRFVSKNYPQCQKVIISGYSEFEYAQEAIHLGVREYLLKPIVYDELSKILQKLRASIESERGEKEKNILKSAVYGEIKSSEMQKVQIAYFCAGPMIKDGFEESVEECDFFKDINLDKIALSLLPKKSTVYSFGKYQVNEKIMLIVCNEDINVRNICTLIVEEAKKAKVCITAVCHREKIDLQEIPSLSRRLRNFMKSNILFGQASVFEDTDPSNKGNRDKQSLFSKIYSGNKNTVLKEAELVFSNEMLRQEELVYFLEEIFKLVFPKSKEYPKENEDTIWNLILYSSNGKALYANLEEILLEKGISEKQETTQELMERVERYVQNHLTEGITVASIADNFGLVPPYLSRLFKEYSGYTLSQYIQKIRLERAKALLKMDGDILAKDVAEIIGYPNPLYFSKIFKKKVGLYPSEYRRRSQEKD